MKYRILSRGAEEVEWGIVELPIIAECDEWNNALLVCDALQVCQTALIYAIEVNSPLSYCNGKEYMRY